MSVAEGSGTTSLPRHAARGARVRGPRHPVVRLAALLISAIVLMPVVVLALIAIGGSAEEWRYIVQSILPKASAHHVLPSRRRRRLDGDRRRRRRPGWWWRSTSPAALLLVGAGAAACGASLSCGLCLRRVLPVHRPGAGHGSLHLRLRDASATTGFPTYARPAARPSSWRRCSIPMSISPPASSSSCRAATLPTSRARSAPRRRKYSGACCCRWRGRRSSPASRWC